MYSSIVGGALLLVLAGLAAFREEARRQRWIQYVNGLAGIGLIAPPFAFELTARPHVAWTHTVGGLIALVLSTLNHSLPRVQGKRLAGAERAS